MTNLGEELIDVAINDGDDYDDEEEVNGLQDQGLDSNGQPGQSNPNGANSTNNANGEGGNNPEIQGESASKEEQKLNSEQAETEEKISPGELYKKLKSEMNTIKSKRNATQAQEYDQTGSAIPPNVNQQHESKFNIPDWFLTQNESKLQLPPDVYLFPFNHKGLEKPWNEIGNNDHYFNYGM